MYDYRPVSQRTRFLFAFVGIVTCLLGALIAELTLSRMKAGAQLRRYHVASLLYVTGPGTTHQVIQPPAPPITDQELQRRLDMVGGQSGEVQVSLTWNNRNDLDLSCQDPYGELIDGYNQSSRSGGFLDVDMNPTDTSNMSPEALIRSQARSENRRTHRTGTSDTAPVENLVWLHDAPVGHYKVFVHQFYNREQADQTPFWVIVRVQGKVQRIPGVMGRDDFAEQLAEPRLVYEFDVGPQPPVAAAPAAKPAPPAPPPPPRIVTHTGYFLGRLDYALRTAGLWGALIGLLPIALLIARQLSSDSRRCTARKDLVVLLGGLATGFTAALLGQLALSLLASAAAPGVMPVFLVLGWTLLGGFLRLRRGPLYSQRSADRRPPRGRTERSRRFRGLSGAHRRQPRRAGPAALRHAHGRGHRRADRPPGTGA